MNKKKRFLFYILLSAILYPVTAQNADGGITENGLNIYVINSYEYIIDGITRPYALNYRAEFKKGEEITGLLNLEKFIRDKTQLIYNERVIESVRIEHTIGEINNEKKYPVDLKIFIKDTWNIIAIPRPQYDSNKGFDITIKARDYNFLGTMSALRVDVGYQRDLEGRNFYSLMLDSDIPVYVFGLYWNIDFDHEYTFRPDMEQEHYYRNTTGISTEIPVRRTILKIGFTEWFYFNQENPVRYRDEYGRFHEGLYLSSRPFLSWKIPLGVNYYDFGEIVYTPALSATFNHELPQHPLPEFRKGPFIYFSNNINFSRIDWHGNFKKGAAAGISNSNSYDFFKLRNDINPFGANFSITGSGFTMLNNFVGLSAQIRYMHYFFDDYYDNGGDIIRGVIDNRVNFNYMLSFNFDLPVRILQLRPSQWHEKNRFLRIFDFDLHVAPVLDIALYNDPLTQTPFGLENMLLGAGLEAVIYPERWRSLFLRISFAVGIQTGNLNAGLTSELFIGTDLFY